ncbi:MAG: RNA polymerase sigma factor [Phycisphaerae bacterium]|nr:RNA polymerase sigma factor [Phycisphaerae bacterium]
MILTEYDYENLLIESQNGNNLSRDRLAIKIQSDIGPYVYRMLHDWQAAEDITQETVLKTFENINAIRNPEGFKAWIYRTAQGNVQMHFRDRKKLETVQEDMPDNYLCKNTKNVLTKLIYQELSDTIAIAMDSIKEIHRQIIILRVYQNLSYKDISKVLGCSQMAAKVRFYKAKQCLKKQLKIGGFNKSMLLPALAIFGKLTSNAKAGSNFPVIASQTLSVSPVAVAIGSGLPLLAVSTVILVLLSPVGHIYDKFAGIFTAEEYETKITVPSQLVSIKSNHDRHSSSRNYASLDNIENMDQYFATKNYEILDIIIEPGESIGFLFPGIITNGPDFDIFITELGPDGEAVEVYLCDEAENELYLGLAQSPKVGRGQGSAVLNYPVTCKFDLSQYEIKFEPRIIKLVGPVAGSIKDDFELHQLHARIKSKSEGNGYEK